MSRHLLHQRHQYDGWAAEHTSLARGGAADALRERVRRLRDQRTPHQVDGMTVVIDETNHQPIGCVVTLTYVDIGATP